MKLSSVWLYEMILKKYRMIGHVGLSGRDSYLRPYLCLDADYNKRPGHVCVVPVTSEREATDIANAYLADKMFLVFCLIENANDNSEAENHSADNFLWTAEENRPGGAYVCIAANDAAAVLNDIQAVFDLCDEWEDSIISLLAGDAGMEKVLEVSAGFLGNPLMVMGTDFSLIADADMEKLPERARLFAEDGVNVEYMNALL
ncbi:MAG: hypothetical protein LUD16_01305 [Lachnospiraceae bacterium]|nr:hypothetical protein [Lachnospiraceae bacterium]